MPRKGFLRLATTHSLAWGTLRPVLSRVVGSKGPPPSLVYLVSHLSVSERCETQGYEVRIVCGCLVAPCFCVHVSAEGPSGVLSTDPCASCFLSGEDRRKHINNMISTSGPFTNVIATTVATNRHLQNIVNNIIAGIATGSKRKKYFFL